MNKEQIIDEAYKNYENKYYKGEAFGYKKLNNLEYSPDLKLSQEEFINKIKTDSEFSETWGLKIEERELSFNERIKHIVNSLKSNAPLLMEEDEKTTQWLNENNIPNKLITITRELSESEIWDYIHKNKIEILHQHAVLYGHEVGSEYRKSFIPTLKENYNIPTKETITSYE